MALPYILLGFLYFAAIFFGGVHLWARSVLALGIFGAALFFLWRSWLAGRLSGRDLIRFLRDPVFLLGMVLLLWAGLSLVPLPAGWLRLLSPETWRVWAAASLVGGSFPRPLSLYPYITLNSLAFGAALLFYYGLARGCLRSRSSVEILVIGLLLLGTLESLYALVLLATDQPYTLWWNKAVHQEVATGSFIDRNHLAGFLSLLICLGIGYLWALIQGHPETLQRKRADWFERLEGHLRSLGTRGILVLSAVALMLTALLSTASRGGALSLLAGLLFMTGMIGVRFLKNRKALVLLLSLISTCGYVGTLALDRVLARFQTFSEGFEERLALARATWRMAADFPLTGSGLGTFEFVFPAYQDHLVDLLVDYAHNDWVQLLAETGWIGFILVGGGLAWLFVAGATRWFKGRDPFRLGVGLGALGALLVIAVHELTEFNLHIPANALLLILIVVLLQPVLFAEEGAETEPGGSGETKARANRWTAFPVILLITTATGTLAWPTLQVWRADSLARTVWNSTSPFRNPSDRNLQQAWALASGNAAYWLWLASRTHTGGSGPFLGPDYAGKGFQDRKIQLLAEGIQRNPTSWVLWRELGWTAAFQSQRDPEGYLPLARQSLERAWRLRPFSAQGPFEYGIIGLSFSRRFGQARGLMNWEEAFRRALRMDPSLSGKVVDQLILYLGPSGAGEIQPLLPDNSRGQLTAARYLLKQGFFPEGQACLTKGEGYRNQEVAALWEKFLQEKKNSSEERSRLLDQILAEDPGHPGALLARGRFLAALNAQERRYGDLKSLAPLEELRRRLETAVPAKESTGEIEYFLGRVAAEAGDPDRAVRDFKKALAQNPHFFSAWLHLKNSSTREGKGGDGQEVLDPLERNIQRYAMEGIVADAWRTDQPSEGFPVWKAPFRLAERKETFGYAFSGVPPKAWKMVLDGRFLLAGGSQANRGFIKTLLPPGEHVLKIISYEGGTPEKDGRIPFNLTVWFHDQAGS